MEFLTERIKTLSISIQKISFPDLKLITISVFLSLILIVVLQSRYNDSGKTKATKERITSRKVDVDDDIIMIKKKKQNFMSCYDFTSILGWETTDTMTTNLGPQQQGPISLGFISQEATPTQEQAERQSGPNSQITVGEALGLLGRTGDRKHRKWADSMKKVAARFARRNTTAGNDRSEGGKPLISLMKEMDRVEQGRKGKWVFGAKSQNGVINDEKACHVCRIRDRNATLAPCEHAFCRVCSREMWINTGCCPICKTQILEVLDTL